jgi:hypothetical protein
MVVLSDLCNWYNNVKWSTDGQDLLCMFSLGCWNEVEPGYNAMEGTEYFVSL